MQNLRVILLSLLVYGALINTGCSKPIPASENPYKLRASMSDRSILKRLNLNRQDFQTEKIQGTDGKQVTYFNQSQRVTIVRSVVTGLNVSAYGDLVNGSWHLGKAGLFF